MIGAATLTTAVPAPKFTALVCWSKLPNAPHSNHATADTPFGTPIPFSVALVPLISVAGCDAANGVLCPSALPIDKALASVRIIRRGPGRMFPFAEKLLCRHALSLMEPLYGGLKLIN